MAVLLLPVVLLKSAESDGGVVVARGVVKERIESAGGVAAARGVAKSALTPLAVLPLPVVLLESALDSAGGVATARGVATERIDSAGGVVAARGVAKSAWNPLAVLRCPWCCSEAH